MISPIRADGAPRYVVVSSALPSSTARGVYSSAARAGTAQRYQRPQAEVSKLCPRATAAACRRSDLQATTRAQPGPDLCDPLPEIARLFYLLGG